MLKYKYIFNDVMVLIGRGLKGYGIALWRVGFANIRVENRLFYIVISCDQNVQYTI
jgi:hypothetical protein